MVELKAFKKANVPLATSEIPRRLGEYVHDDLQQYSPGIADGREGLRQHLLSSQWFSGVVGYRALPQVIAEATSPLPPARR